MDPRDPDVPGAHSPNPLPSHDDAFRGSRRELVETRILQRAIFASASYMIVVTSADGVIQLFNPAAERTLGYAADEVEGAVELAALVAPRGLLEHAREVACTLGRPVSGAESLFARCRDGGTEEREWTFVGRDGRRIPVALSVTALHDGTGPSRALTGYLAVGVDITDRRKAEELLRRVREELEQRVHVRTRELMATNEALQKEIRERRKVEERMRHIAHHDILTGLPNRFQLQERLRKALSHAAVEGRQVIVMFIDLDRFKNINDTLGHAIGDRLLREVGERLRGCIRDQDFIARIGGDEFVVVLTDVKSTAVARDIAEKLLHALHDPFAVDPHELSVTASIGLCVYPRDGDSVDALMKNADTAMYRAKARGRNNFQRFAASMTRAAVNSFHLETGLRRALDRDELELCFLPVIHAVERRVLGVEALLRWNHPERGQLAPADFISVAEESGLIVPIGEWALGQACRHAASWQRDGSDRIPVAVNLSGRQFWQRNLVALIRKGLADSGLRPECLELEVGEATLMSQVDDALPMLAQLSGLGVRLTIDDFGTGYSNLSMLKRFPVDALKIDRTFVRDIDRDPDDAAIVSAIIALAQTMGLVPIAEGVESASQCDLLVARGCVAMQGYLFSEPMNSVELADYLQAQAPVASAAALRLAS